MKLFLLNTEKRKQLVTMIQESRYFWKVPDIWYQVICSLTVFLIAVNLNLCHCTGNQDMLSAEFDILPILSDICSPKGLKSQTDINTNRRLDPATIDILKESNLYPKTQSPSHPNLNESLSETSHVLIDELIMCMDQFFGPGNNGSKHITGPGSVQNAPSDTQPSSRLPNKDDLNMIDSFFNQTDSMEFDPQILMMLKDFDQLSQAVKNKTDFHKGTFDDMEDHDATQVGNRNNTFLNSAITLYETFVSHYNITDGHMHDNIGANPSQQNNYSYNLQNDNGILFHQDSFLSDHKR